MRRKNFTGKNIESVKKLRSIDVRGGGNGEKKSVTTEVIFCNDTPFVVLFSLQEVGRLHVRCGQSEGQGELLEGLTHQAVVLGAGEAHVPADGHGLLPLEPHEAGDDVDRLLPVAVGEGVDRKSVV